ncbi:MAG: DUF58 domain-containing protein [Planctomycetaceae bacterium]|nr:DUF58 domain-containing protein [Planctomycetaceae bacterium]
MDRDAVIGLARDLARPYRLTPPRERSGGRIGAFAGRRDGHSVDFHDFRQYQPGDDLRRVDWRGYARNGQLHLKLFREEVAPVVEVHLDASASMAAYPGKEEAVVFTAAFLFETAVAAEGRPVLVVNARRHAGNDFRSALAAVRFTGGAVPAAATPGGPGGAVPVRFFLSDFLFTDGLADVFARHQAGSGGFHPLMFLSASETNPPWRGQFHLHDIENPDVGVDMVVGADAVRAYKERLHRHSEGLAALAARFGTSIVRIDAPDAPADNAFFRTLADRLFRERLVSSR